MLKILRIIFISAALLTSAVTSFAADEPCLNAKTECLKYIRTLAEQGDVIEQAKLGAMYFNGVGVVVDRSEALRWFRLAAEQGHGGAQLVLGRMYHKGKGVEALRWFQLSAEQGIAESQYLLGGMYDDGLGIEKDKRKAAHWYLLAAEQGHVNAQYFLGKMYYRGEGVEQDKREAVRWYRLAAEQGDVDVQYLLGLIYFEENGVGKDAGEAVRWFRMAAEQGHAYAQYSLGLRYDNGEGVAVDKREAVRLYRLAAEQGNADSQHNLGRMYFNGQGVIKDEREAYIWFLIASAGGNINAGKTLQGIISWEKYLTLADTRSAKREAVQRFEEIENQENSEQSSDNNSEQKGGGEFAVAKPPEQSDVAAEVFENTWRSVVVVKDSEGQGSGVIIRPNMVATNCHVIEGGDIIVYKPENRRINESTPFSAEVIHRNEKDDFCVLEVKGLWGIAATIRKYRTLKIGENVYALGAPRGLDLSLSNGLISQLRTDGDARFIQTDAAISPGSSGGGLFDKEGNFIGILTSKYADEQTEGIGFAIPADLVLQF